MEEVDIVIKAKQGDLDATEMILMKNMNSMYRIAFGILRTEDEIQDAISSTIEIVLRKINTLKDINLFKTWLTRILINECYKILKQNKKIVYLDSINQEEAYYHHHEYSDFEIKEMINKMDKDLKEIVILYYFEDSNVREIASLLKIPEGTVKSRLSRARNQLKGILIENDEERRDKNG